MDDNEFFSPLLTNNNIDCMVAKIKSDRADGISELLLEAAMATAYSAFDPHTLTTLRSIAAGGDIADSFLPEQIVSSNQHDPNSVTLTVTESILPIRLNTLVRYQKRNWLVVAMTNGTWTLNAPKPGTPGDLEELNQVFRRTKTAAKNENHWNAPPDVCQLGPAVVTVDDRLQTDALDSEAKEVQEKWLAHKAAYAKREREAELEREAKVDQRARECEADLATLQNRLPHAKVEQENVAANSAATMKRIALELEVELEREAALAARERETKAAKEREANRRNGVLWIENKAAKDREAEQERAAFKAEYESVYVLPEEAHRAAWEEQEKRFKAEREFQENKDREERQRKAEEHAIESALFWENVARWWARSWHQLLIFILTASATYWYLPHLFANRTSGSDHFAFFCAAAVCGIVATVLVYLARDVVVYAKRKIHEKRTSQKIESEELAISGDLRISTVVLVLLADAALIGALGDNTPSYYTMLRWLTCAAALTLLSRASLQKCNWSAVPLFLVAILFNPILPVHLHGNRYDVVSTWRTIDIVVATLISGALIYLEIRVFWRTHQSRE